MDEKLVKQVLEGTAMVHKVFMGSIKSINEQSRTATFTISTGDVDRDNDILEPKGWDLKDYKKNPVVLWAHNSYVPPIAKASKTKVQDGKELVSTATFATREQHELADTIFKLILGRFLNTASVGFRPLESTWDDVRGGFNFLKQALHEWSVVPVPANPNALVSAKEAGIDVGVIFKWATDALDMLACKTTAKCELESVWKTLANPQVQVAGFQEDDVIQDALELAQVDEGFKKALLVGLTGIDLDATDDDDGDTVVLQRDGGEEVLVDLELEPSPKDSDVMVVDLVEPEPEPVSLDPSADDVGLGSINPDDLKKVIREEIRTSLTAVDGRLPD